MRRWENFGEKEALLAAALHAIIMRRACVLWQPGYGWQHRPQLMRPRGREIDNGDNRN
jgi:hypothetical protein